MMKTKVLAVVLGAIALIYSSRYVHGAPPTSDETEVSVAGYPNTPVNQKVGDRIVVIFKAHHIQTDGWPASAGVTVNVPAFQADKARRVLAHAVLDEGLPILIYRPASKADRVVVVAPEVIPGLPPKPSPQADRVVVVAPEVILGLPPKH